MTDLRLDTIEGCVAELTACNQEVAGFAAQWAEEAGELKTLGKRYDRLYKEALRVTEGRNADERAATAHAAAEETYRMVYGIDEDAPGLSERMEELIGNVEKFRRLFDTVERRSSNVQSIMKLRREEGSLDSFVPRDDPARMAARR